KVNTLLEQAQAHDAVYLLRDLRELLSFCDASQSESRRRLFLLYARAGSGQPRSRQRPKAENSISLFLLPLPAGYFGRADRLPSAAETFASLPQTSELPTSSTRPSSNPNPLETTCQSGLRRSKRPHSSHTPSPCSTER